MPVLFYIILVACSNVEWSWGWFFVALLLWALD